MSNSGLARLVGYACCRGSMRRKTTSLTVLPVLNYSLITYYTPDPLPPNNLQVVSTDGCYLNHSFNSNQESDVFDVSNRSSCVLQNPDNASLGIPVTSNFQQPPYFYSTYV